MSRKRLPQLLRYLLGTALLVALLASAYIGRAVKRFYAHQTDVYRAQAATLRLPTLPAPTSKTRLLVFAPHCDDDILGCAGLIQQTLKAGGKVRVVTMTNGDGFRAAVQRQERRLRVDPNDFMQFAYQRQEESIKALTSLGVNKNEIFFLGYPDRGLSELWNAYWTPDHLYTSLYTRCQRSPYKNAKTPNAPYCGESVLQDVLQVMREFTPTLITVTHPDDDHIDHTAASAFVTLARSRLNSYPQLLYYLVHRGNWPSPPANRESAVLNPPTEMSHLDTQWFALPLSAAERAVKEAAIRDHETQTTMTGAFLLSFACRNELFGIPPIYDLASSEQEPHEVVANPVADSFPRAKFGEGDIQEVLMKEGAENLRVVVRVRENASPRIRYQLRLRMIESASEISPAALIAQTNDSAALKRQGIRVSFEGKEIQFEIPAALLKIGVGTLAVSVETSLAGVEIDKTGIHLVNVSGRM